MLFATQSKDPCSMLMGYVDLQPNPLIDLAKLAEAGFNLTFITMRDRFQMVVHIPYPVTVPKYYAVTSEMATMDLLRILA